MGHGVAQEAIIVIGARGCRTSIVKKESRLKTGHWMGGLHWVYEGIKLHAVTGQKSNRLCSKGSKIRANRIKHKYKISAK
jgi:hypothetical protein